MKKSTRNTNLDSRKKETPAKRIFFGYPPYPASEDIYGKYQKDRKIDPEDPANVKITSDNYSIGKYNEKDFDEDVTGSDLDIPGPELDEKSEQIGNEDEENKYYSLGGDDHNDLDEENIELNP